MNTEVSLRSKILSSCTASIGESACEIGRLNNKLLCLLLLALRASSRIGRVVQSRALSCFISGDISGLRSVLIAIREEAWRFALREMHYADEHNICVLNLAHPDYPLRLLQTSDAPPLLFIRGKLPYCFSDMAKSLVVAIVGTRRASPYGQRIARRLAAEVTMSGATVVSGLALGIDAVAHGGALDAACANEGYVVQKLMSPGIAVLGSGVLCVCPKRNYQLAEKLLNSGGALISEFNLYEPPSRYSFPQRNRIISGISDVVIVVEAGKRSGALITARLAAEQGREVMAVPGPVDSKVSEGSNTLLQTGAYLVRSIEDIYDLIPRLRPKVDEISDGVPTREKKAVTSVVASEVLSTFVTERRNVAKSLIRILSQYNTCSFDKLTETLRLSPPEIRSVLVELELHGIIRIEPGDLVAIGDVVDIP